MFTGIIQEIGILKNKYKSENKYQLQIGVDEVLADLTIGESIAVNGVCLTVVSFSENSFTADVMPETLRKTNLENTNKGDKLNLELPLKPGDLMGGHMVSGHIDGVGILKDVKAEKNAKIISVEFDSELDKYMVDKGSVAINGISLTIMEVQDNILKVSLIPETWEKTNLKYIQPGDKINIETDLIGKYVVKMWEKYQDSDRKSDSNIDRSFLAENGFM